MPIVTLAPDVYWSGSRTGITHLRHRHSDRARTTYNSYLVKGRRRRPSSDCVKRPFAASFLRNIEEILPVSKPSTT